MSVNLKVVLGTVNYTDYLHVAAAKISSPSTIVWEDWIPMPKTSYTFIIPDLDPENYYISYYDAPTNSSLGTLQMQIIVNALTGQVIGERRFYTCGGPGTYDPAAGSSTITDPYLIGKNVTGFFKEAFRFYKPGVEYSFDDTTGIVSDLTGNAFNNQEVIAIELTYDTGAQNASSGSGNGLYSQTVTVTEDTRTLTAAEIDSRVRLAGTSATQVVTVCLLSAIAVDKGYYFDNSVGGTAVQVKILFPGTDKLRFNGFNTSNILFAEFWVSKGEHLLIRKYDDNYWEVIGDYAGVKVGRKCTLGYNAHPGTLVEQLQLIDGDEYPRLWWWLNNVLPSTHKYVDDTVVNDPFTGFQQARAGQFALHSTLKKFRMPYTVYLTERGLNNFLDGSSGDPDRTVDYPGGWQEESVGEHTHDDLWGDTTGHGSSSTPLNGTFQWLVNVFSGSSKGFGKVSSSKTGGVTGGPNNENRVRNTGVVYAREI